jgi:hypothetical protein
MTAETSDSVAVSEIKHADDIVIERRLNTIFDIRRQIHELRRQAGMGLIKQHSKYEVQSGYRSLVTNYLMELHPLLLKYDDVGHHLLYEYDFGVEKIKPRIEIRQHGISEQYYLIRPERGDVPYQQASPGAVGDVELKGLTSLQEVDDPLKGVVVKEVRDPVTMSMQEQRIPFAAQIGMQTLDDMTLRMNEFISQVGLELEPDRDDDPGPDLEQSQFVEDAADGTTVIDIENTDIPGANPRRDGLR